MPLRGTCLTLTFLEPTIPRRMAPAFAITFTCWISRIPTCARCWRLTVCLEKRLTSAIAAVFRPRSDWRGGRRYRSENTAETWAASPRRSGGVGGKQGEVEAHAGLGGVPFFARRNHSVRVGMETETSARLRR